MKPPYEITQHILKLVASISEKLGEVSATHLHKVSPELRKKNRIKTIQASLEIEGNTLSEAQITAIIENKRVLGPEKDILEVSNAIRVYDILPELDPSALTSFLKAHKLLMEGLIDRPGEFRSKSVGIAKGTELAHLAPPPGNLRFLMKDLFDYLKNEEDHVLIKSSVVHYEIEFIHPFMDGNGRMGRLWQTLILLQKYPVFEYLPFETLIKERQNEYYRVLSQSDKAGKSTLFIEFMLKAIDDALASILPYQNRPKTTKDRIDYFISTFKGDLFSRKDYMATFKDISSATASRDLKYATDQKLVEKKGDKRTSTYKLLTRNPDMSPNADTLNL